MAIPANALHLVYSGKLASGEIFNWGTWHDGAAVTGDQLKLDKISGWAALGIQNQVMGASVVGGFPAALHYDTVTAYLYTSGDDAADMVSQSTINKSGTGSSGNSLPTQVSMVATLLTARVGRSFRGRCYLPAPNTVQLNANGQVADVFVGAYNTALAGALSALRTGDATTGVPPAPPVVFSRKRQLLTPVTSVRMDSRLDVQRSRGDSETGITEAFHAV